MGVVSVQPQLSVVIPTFDNVRVLARCLEAWQVFAGDEPVEVIVIEDGCRDETPQYLEQIGRSPWGREHLRWVHEAGLHELRCTNRGLRMGRAGLLLAWQDDMFLACRWLVAELVATFATYRDLGLLCLSRGLNCLPLDEPIAKWEDLTDWRRLQSTIGPAPFNWFRVQEVDLVIRPWLVRKSCLEAAGYLDEAFVPTEWDEADLSFRVRRAGWKVGTHGYERLGAYTHLGSSTISRGFTDQYKERVLRNGRLFHERWDGTIRAEASRSRRTWWRRASPAAWLSTVARACRAAGRLLPTRVGPG
jgi:GT2 family glycosyltransferase